MKGTKKKNRIKGLEEIGKNNQSEEIKKYF